MNQADATKLSIVGPHRRPNLSGYTCSAAIGVSVTFRRPFDKRRMGLTEGGREKCAA